MSNKSQSQCGVRFYKSVLMKIWLGASAIGIIISLAIGYTAYITDKSDQMAEVKDSTTAYATIAAAKIDGDAFETITTESGHNEAYEEIHACLTDFLSVDTIHYIYTLRLVEDHMEFVVDSDPVEPGEVGDYYEVGQEAFDTYNTGVPYAIDEPYTDQWGTDYSGYAAFRNSAGKIVGIVAVDCSANTVNAKLGVFIRKIVIVAIICIIAGMIAGLLLAYFITRNLRRVNDRVYSLVENGGDLTQKLTVKSGDEIGQIAGNINLLLEKLRVTMAGTASVISTVKDVSVHINSNMHEMGTNTAQLSTDTQHMNELMRSTNKRMTQVITEIDTLGSEISGMHKRADDGNDFATDVKTRAALLQQQAADTTANARQISESLSLRVTESTRKAQRIDEIQKFSDAIINIAKQTNILSINARIEAARAGEMGKGFAVVANEIGSLADTTQSSASQISSVLGAVSDAVAELIDASEQLVSFIAGDVSNGFDSFAATGTKYLEDATRIETLMSGFKEDADSLQSGVEHFQSFTGDVSAVLAETMTKLDKVNTVMSDFNAQMTDIDRMTADNTNQIVALSRNLEEDYVY